MPDDNPEPLAHASRYDLETTMFFKDVDGNYYAIPTRHLPTNLVKPEFVPQVEAVLGSSKKEDTLQFLGIFEMSRSVRRTWVPPEVTPIGVDRPMPTS
ncbi:hypothetical protein GR205_27595 [Rhizobium leguminosarum]|uniref:hypothetical protein n=1 Tax=Rhizobium ruizarguesonis TaxID=2081791 RepID=UPI0013DEA999|nr:hypothetical protein [Rhizobium ruizarguesonis]NEJ31743.1 hypothetical protein [Rhizobium ruizarguesonis]